MSLCALVLSRPFVVFVYLYSYAFYSHFFIFFTILTTQYNTACRKQELKNDVPARYNFVRNGVHIVSITRRNGVCMLFC